VHYVIAATGDDIPVRWQEGFSARLNPTLEIVAPDGAVIAREGEVVDGRGGGTLGNDDPFTVCLGEYRPKRAAPQP